MSPIPLYQTFTFILQHFSPFENFHPFFFILNVFPTAGKKTFRLSSISCSFIFPEMRFWTIFMALQHVLRYHPRQLVNLSIFQISSPPSTLQTFNFFFLNLVFFLLQVFVFSQHVTIIWALSAGMEGHLEGYWNCVNQNRVIIAKELKVLVQINYTYFYLSSIKNADQ